MPSVTIHIDSNLAEVLRSYKALPAGIQNALRAGLRLGLEAIRGGIQRRITTTFRTTGADGLRKAISVSVDEAKLEGTIRADKNYAAVHEFGTVGKGGTLPDIVPVNAKALRFEIQTATRIAPLNGPYRRLVQPKEINKVIFSKRVSIPARPFFFPAIQENLQQVPKQIRSQIDSYLESRKV